MCFRIDSVMLVHVHACSTKDLLVIAARVYLVRLPPLFDTHVIVLTYATTDVAYTS